MKGEKQTTIVWRKNNDKKDTKQYIISMLSKMINKMDRRNEKCEKRIERNKKRIYIGINNTKEISFMIEKKENT